MCAIVNDGQRKFHLEDVAFIDVSGYNGRISTLIDRFERMYFKYGKERTAEFIKSVASDVRLRFFPVDRGRSDRTTQKSENRPRKECRFESDGGDAGERHQRSRLPEGSGEVTNIPDGIKLSIRDLPSEVIARELLADGTDVMAETVEAKNALTIYQQLLTKHAEASTALLEAERDLEGKTGDELAAARKVTDWARAGQNDLYNRLLKVERSR